MVELDTKTSNYQWILTSSICLTKQSICTLMRNECDLQHLILQLFSAFFLPTQFFPPFSGTGLSHFRVLICFPFVLGHLTLHFDHLLHFPQPPSTKRIILNFLLSEFRSMVSNYITHSIPHFQISRCTFILTGSYTGIATDPSAIHICFIAVLYRIAAMCRVNWKVFESNNN